MEVYIKTSTSIKIIFQANLLITVHAEIDYSVLPSFQPVPVSGQKSELGYFLWDFNSSSTKAIRRKNEHLCYQLMVLVGFLVVKQANKKGFCSSE